MSPPVVRLRPKHDHRVRAGHPWIFSNEIADDVSALPLGGTVDVHDASGAFLGRGTGHPASLISVRLLTRERLDIDGVGFWRDALRSAAALRHRVLPDARFGRLVHAEGDGLSGLVVDRYGDLAVAQFTSAGTEARRDRIVEALQGLDGLRRGVERSEGRARQLEGLPDRRGVIWGDDDGPVDIVEHGVPFRIDPIRNAKTGHFYDQAPNRAWLGARCKGSSVLDVYSHTGGFAQHALAHGASAVTLVDRSEIALQDALANAALLGAADRVTLQVADGKDALTAMVATGRTFDVVSVDPPAFAKARKHATLALKAYEEVNALALALVAPGGLFATSSCSWHVHEERFLEAVVAAARRAGRSLRGVRRGEAGPDHPVDPAVPESRYLKHLVFEVTPARGARPTRGR